MRGLHFNNENWRDVLSMLGYWEKPNPNSYDCYDVYDQNDIPHWQYEGESEKEMLYYFFYGRLCGRKDKMRSD